MRGISSRPGVLGRHIIKIHERDGAILWTLEARLEAGISDF